MRGRAGRRGVIGGSRVALGCGGLLVPGGPHDGLPIVWPSLWFGGMREPRVRS